MRYLHRMLLALLGACSSTDRESSHDVASTDCESGEPSAVIGTGEYAWEALAPAIIAAPLVLIAVLPIVRACAAGIHRIMPADETSAVNPSSFVGRTAFITNGVARTGLPADARLLDQFGTEHHVLVEPEDVGQSFAAGQVVLLVRQSGSGRFAVITNPNDALTDSE